MIKRIKKHKYIRKTARSSYERGLEHQEALTAYYHQGAKIKEINFGTRVIKYISLVLPGQSWREQILDSVSVKIQEE